YVDDLEWPGPLVVGSGPVHVRARLRRALVPTAPEKMPTYYYGTIPVLAWILNHYFYGGVHYAWLAKEFLPPKPNPSSSNPHHIYGEFKDAWNDGDPWNSTVLTARTGMLRGVKAKRDAGVVKRWTATRLRFVCQHVSVDLFYPIVYRVDVERISPDRLVVANSGLRGSARGADP
ncbi:MAG TPA: hypothetical protein VEY93_01085, partial [Longimicrobium sp.]|nr:hypothetical protein [Longimicrobium sp.]